MKLNFKCLQSISGILIGLSLITSCTKEVPPQLSNSKLSGNYEAQEEQEESRIKTVLNYFDNNNEYSGSDFTFDSAVYFLEACPNYKFSQFENPREINFSIEKTYTLTKSNTTVAFDDLKTIYDSIQNLIIESHNANTTSDFYFVDIEPNLDTETSSSIQLITRVYFQNGISLDGTISDLTFDPEHDYYWGMLLGKCDNSQNGITDAALKLTQYGNYNQKILQQAAPTGKRIFYTNVAKAPTAIWSNFVNTSVTFGSSGGFAYSDIFAYEDAVPEHKVCIDDEKLNFYLAQMKSVVIPARNPSGKVFLDIKVLTYGEVMPDAREYKHFYNITFGKQMVTSDPSSL